VQTNEGLYFRSLRLATRFESNAANIAKVLVKALLNSIIKFNIQEIQVVKTVKIIFPPFFLQKFIVKISKTLCDRRIYHHIFCSRLFGFFPLGLCRRQPRNRQIHRQVCWKRHRISGVVGKQRNIGFVGFLGNVEPKWCRKYRKGLCCEIFVTKSKLEASLAVWRNLLPYIFQGGLQPGSPSRRAALVVRIFTPYRGCMTHDCKSQLVFCVFKKKETGCVANEDIIFEFSTKAPRLHV